MSMLLIGGDRPAKELEGSFDLLAIDTSSVLCILQSEYTVYTI